MPNSTTADLSIAQTPWHVDALSQQRQLHPATEQLTAAHTQNAALTGASRAFQSTPNVPAPSPNTYSGHHGALAAATKVGGRVSHTTGMANGTDKNTSSLAAALPAAVQVFPQHGTRSTITSAANSPTFGPIGRHREFAASAERLTAAHPELGFINRQSPSYIAASLAALRATPAPQSPTLPHLASHSRGRLTPRSLSPVSSHASLAPRAQTPLDTKDETSIQATHELVAMFEAGKSGSQPPQRPLQLQQQPANTVIRSSQPILSPVPLRPAKRPPEPVKPAARQPRPNPPPSSPSPAAVSPVEKRAVYSLPPKPAPPPNRLQKSKPSISPAPKVAPAPAQPPKPKPAPVLSRLETKPANAPLNRPAPVMLNSDSDSDDYASAEDTFPRPPTPPRGRRGPAPPQPRGSRKPELQPSTIKPRKADSPPHVVPPPRPSSAISRRPVHPITAASAARLKPQLTADSLADAIVASSLASSRVPSPSKDRYASPFSRLGMSHKTYSYSLLVPSSATSPTGIQTPLRPLSPMKSGGMRQTMRRTESSGGSASNSARERSRSRDRRSHGFLVRKHPHKHAEGDRRRWRDSVTPTERKRYEGVWAANRGLLMAPGSEEVHAFAVRDLWTRSGLGAPTLEQIWELVAGGGRPGSNRVSLRRDEFVAGLWLVDQSLKGRRLPIEVSESVWASVRNLPAGIRTR